MENLCPCQSGVDFQLCCAPLITGTRSPALPVELMRSRYTAFVLQNVDYLIATWHPDSNAAQWRSEISGNFVTTQWLGLVILHTTDVKQSDEGYVEFIARFYDETKQRPGFIHERSRFVRMAERWYYVDGVHKLPARNDPCPCGSGKKFKKCCGS